MTGPAPSPETVLGTVLTEAGALRVAVDASWAAAGRASPNPAVGAVVLDPGGRVRGTGATAAPGGPHAEVAALQQAGAAARGGTAVVTLEPCDHAGRTAACSRALIDAGIARVVYALADPTPTAAGGARTLQSAGVTAVDAAAAGLDPDGARRGPLRPWLHRQRTGLPLVTLKIAATIDGRAAAPDGSSRWITGPAARAEVHARRSRLDAIIVGTGTVLADDPALTARHPDGTLREHQPLRVVAGDRDVPPRSAVFGEGGETVLVPGHDPLASVEALAQRCCDVQIEGGPRLAGAFVGAGLIDCVEHYAAPAILGDGRAAVTASGVGTIAEALRLRRTGAYILGDDLLLTYDRDVAQGADSAGGAG